MATVAVSSVINVAYVVVRQVESPIPKSYPLEVKQLCLKMYLNGMGLRGIEGVTEIHHTTIMGVAELRYDFLEVRSRTKSKNSDNAVF